MEPRPIEFAELRGDPERREGVLVAAGRCHLGPIRVGDRFTSLVDHKGVEHCVELGVVDIGMYGQYVLEIDPVVSGELFLTGELDPNLAIGATLYGLMPGEPEEPCVSS